MSWSPSTCFVVVVVVRNKVRQSYNSRTVCPRITMLYRHGRAHLPYTCTGYDVTRYFRSAAKCNYILAKSDAENGSGRPKSRIIRPLFNVEIHAGLLYSRTRYDVTSYFRFALIKIRKTAENAACDGFGSKFSGAAFCLPHQLVGFLLRILRSKSITSLHTP